jgi:hypothetical protein
LFIVAEEVASNFVAAELILVVIASRLDKRYSGRPPASALLDHSYPFDHALEERCNND